MVLENPYASLLVAEAERESSAIYSATGIPPFGVGADVWRVEEKMIGRWSSNGGMESAER